MNEQIKEYLDKYPRDIIDMYYTFRKLILTVFHLNHRKRCGLNSQPIM